MFPLDLACAVEDDLGNRFLPLAMGMVASMLPDAVGGGTIRAYAQFRYASTARSITVRQQIANARGEDCDSIPSERVPVRGEEVSGQLDDIRVTYLGIQSMTVSQPGEETEISQRCPMLLNQKYGDIIREPIHR